MLTRGNNEDLEKHCQSEKKEAGWYCNPYTHIRPVYTWYYHSYYSQVIQSKWSKWDIGVYTCFFICISNVPLVNTVIGFQGRVSNFVISYARVSLHVDKGYSESNIKLLLSEMYTFWSEFHMNALHDLCCCMLISVKPEKFCESWWMYANEDSQIFLFCMISFKPIF